MLDTDIVSIDDSLFNMGLDSLMAIKFSVAAHKVFGIYIDIKDLYKYDSIRALADFVDNQVHSNKNYLPEIQKQMLRIFILYHLVKREFIMLVRWLGMIILFIIHLAQY